MRIFLPLFVLIVFTVACGQMGSSSTPATNSSVSNGSAPAAKVEKLLDVASLLGKSMEEVKRIVGTPPKNEMPNEFEWRIPDKYDLDVDFTGGKATRMTFELPSGTGANKPEQLAALAGIDLGGHKPDSEDMSFTTYNNLPVGTTSVYLSFNKIGETFRSVSVEPGRK